MPGLRSLRAGMPWVLLLLWLAGTAVAFWWFDTRLQRPFVHDVGPLAHIRDQTKLPLPQREALAAATGRVGEVTLVHFRDRSCPCSRFNDPHLEAIMEAYRDQGIRLVTVDATDTGVLARRLRSWLPVPASPAALVVDRAGEVAYFGPYSTGSGCLTGAGTFVERAIERALKGVSDPQLNLLNTGCYCAWPAGVTAPQET